MDRRTMHGLEVPALVLVWCASFSVSVYHLLTHEAPVLATVLGQWSLLVATLAFGGMGYHILRDADTSRARSRISRHAFAMFALAGLASGGYATHQFLSPLTDLPIEGIVFQALFVALIGGSAGLFIGRGVTRRDRNAAQLAAVNNLHEIALDVNRKMADQGSREEIERVVCDRLAASPSYEFAWVGTLDERTQAVTPSTAANAQGYLDTVTATADANEREPADQALHTGNPQIAQDIGDRAGHESWRERAAERGINCVAAIPIAYEDDVYGTLNVYTARERAFNGAEREVVRQLGEIMGLAIAAVERERELAHERERLEFVNRLIRHNLLNGLNVIQARTQILEPHVDPEGHDDLAVVRERTEDMVDMVQTLRSLMRVLVREEDHELERIDLLDVLRDQLEKVDQAFNHVEFDVRVDPDANTTVLADDLLGKVFSNLLINAVQHNDAEVPQIDVNVEVREQSVVVHVADNGPGIPDELRGRLFEKGEKSFTSPGTGFGLYLVREIVEGYGGTISVADNDPEGAVFSITFPRP